MINTRSFLKCIIQIYYKTSHGVTVNGGEKLPVCGPYIIASNHISNHDPILLGVFLNPTIKFMAKDELFRIPVLRSIVKKLNAFPVKRTGTGIGAIRYAILLLKMGEVVGIFPEGTRNRDGRQLPWKPGVGFIVTKANLVPIVPIAICARRAKLFRQFHIIVGEPIIPFHSDYRLLAQDVMQTIQNLKSSVELSSTSCIVGQESIQ